MNNKREKGRKSLLFLGLIFLFLGIMVLIHGTVGMYDQSVPPAVGFLFIAYGLYVILL